jgi:hypothetical protein
MSSIDDESKSHLGLLKVHIYISRESNASGKINKPSHGENSTGFEGCCCYELTEYRGSLALELSQLHIHT